MTTAMADQTTHDSKPVDTTFDAEKAAGSGTISPPSSQDAAAEEKSPRDAHGVKVSCLFLLLLF